MLIFRLTNGQLSLHDARESTGGYRATIKNLKPCPKRYLLMQLARVALRRVVPVPRPGPSRYKRMHGWRRVQYVERRGQYPRMRISICTQECAVYIIILEGECTAFLASGSKPTGAG